MEARVLTPVAIRHADRPIVTILLAPDGAPMHTEPRGVVFPATALTALQRASSELTGSPHFTVIFPTQRLDAWRLSNGTVLANLLLRRAGETERAAMDGPVLDGDVLAPREARPQETKAAVAEKEDKPEIVPPEPEIAPAARPPIIEPEPEGQPEPAEPEGEEQGPEAAAVLVAAPRPQARNWPPRRLIIARLFSLGLLLVGLAVLLAPLGLGMPNFGSSPRSTPGTGNAFTSPVASKASRPAPSATAPIQLSYAGSLHYHSSGAGVALLQARLRQLHYYNYPDLTGYFGDATYGALWTFQQQRHLATTGIADKTTIDALNTCDASCTY